MFHVTFARLAVAALAFHSVSASADSIDVDLHGAIERAHRAAPEAIAARGRIREAEAGLVGAGVTFTANPEIEGGAGPRFTGNRPIDAELRIEQDLEPWRRSPRRQLARAEVAKATADADAQVRELDLEVALAFYDALHAGSRSRSHNMRPSSRNEVPLPPTSAGRLARSQTLTRTSRKRRLVAPGRR